ncbi:hypothetical protein AB0C18_32905 [Nonomuraea muscovyensis]
MGEITRKSGKTTLMWVLAGELRPDAGEVRRTGRVGFFRQDEPDTDDMRWALRQGLPIGAAHRPVLQAYTHGRPGSLDEHADALLALGPSDLGLRFGSRPTGSGAGSSWHGW